MEIDLSQLKPDIRKLSDMRMVLADQEWAKTAEDIDLYYMYRGLEKNNDLRYDITVVPANMLGAEFTKTKGHYHVSGYQEVYTVLSGEAIYFLQKLKEGTENEIEDVFAVKAAKGDVLVIPHFYGHITINPSKTEELKMANWIWDGCKSDYSLFEKFQGACYYYMENGWIKNEKYKEVPELKFQEPGKAIPEDLEFLKQA